MASDPISSVSGLASGIQWRDMVDQIMQGEQLRQLAPLTNRQTQTNLEKAAWLSYQDIVTKLRDAARALSDSATLTPLSSTATASASGRALLTATANGSATPGTYSVEVLSLATAEKLSSNRVTGSTTALGLSGSFLVNGKKVTIDVADTLASVRDKINAVNTGTSSSRVSATILSATDGTSRLVLTSEVTGASGIELVDDSNAASGVLQQLGFFDGGTSAHLGSDGRVQSNAFSSTTLAIASMLGVTMPPPSTIKIDGKVITVDLTTDSIASLVSKINAAGGSASTRSEIVNGTTVQRLVIDGAVAIDDTATDTVASQRTLEALGLVRGGTSGVKQAVSTTTAFTDANSASAATASTLLTDLTDANGNALQNGSAITIRGVRADGSTVSSTFTVTATSTLGDLLGFLGGDASAFGGANGAVASLDAGRIVLTDRVGGESRLSLSLSVDGAFGFGAAATTTAGRSRQIAAGTDATFKIDGVYSARSTNTIGDAIDGVTLNLQAAEVGAPVKLTVARDVDAAVKTVQSFAQAYNDVLTFVNNQRTNGALAHNGTLRTTMSSFTQAMLSTVTGVTGAFTRAGLVGVALSRTGTLEVDATKLKSAFTSNNADVVRLFSTSSTALGAGLEVLGGTSKTQPGTYGVTITQVATKALATGSGFSGVYTNDGAADTLTLTDAVSGRSAAVQLENGDSLDAIVARLNAQFLQQKMAMKATNVAGQLSFESTSYGSSGFTVAFTSGNGTDVTGQFGIAAGSFAGLDVAGSFTAPDGITIVPATGRGQLLTASSGAGEGLSMRYTGVGSGNVGTVTHVLGVAGMMLQAADQVVRASDGTIANQTASITRSLASLDTRISDVQQRLDRRRESLIKQFTAMETALARLQAQGSWLTSQLSALQSQNNQ